MVLADGYEKVLGSEFTNYLNEMGRLYKMYIDAYRERVRPVIFEELCVNLGEFSHTLSKEDDKLRRVIDRLKAQVSFETALVVISSKIIGEYYDGRL